MSIKPTEKYPQHIIDFIVENYKGTGPAKLARLLNEKYGTCYTRENLKDFCKRHALKSGLDNHASKGHIPWNKGIVYDIYPEGALRQRSDYCRRKVNGKWVKEHIRVWEEAYGPVPEGCRIRFLDKNPHNCELSNLVLVDAAEHITIARMGGYTADTEVNKVITSIAKLDMQTKKAERKIKDEH